MGIKIMHNFPQGSLDALTIVQEPTMHIYAKLEQHFIMSRQPQDLEICYFTYMAKETFSWYKCEKHEHLYIPANFQVL